MLPTLATAFVALGLTVTGAPEASAGTAHYTCIVGKVSSTECWNTYRRFANSGVRVWGYHKPYCTQYFCYDGGFYYAR